jgi:methylated-DNA-[protein]-cysteine S-methyltransferase
MPSALQATRSACVAQRTLTTRLGPLLLARSQRGLCGVWFEGQSHHPGVLAVPVKSADPVLDQAAAELNNYFAGGASGFTVPLEPQGTAFERQVWLALRDIAYGQTRTYSELAHSLGAAQAVRAVGAAIGKNPLSIIVPCHRVLGRGGRLTGYAGGLPRKQALLNLELSTPSPL